MFQTSSVKCIFICRVNQLYSVSLLQKKNTDYFNVLRTSMSFECKTDRSKRSI